MIHKIIESQSFGVIGTGKQDQQNDSGVFSKTRGIRFGFVQKFIRSRIQDLKNKTTRWFLETDEVVFTGPRDPEELRPLCLGAGTGVNQWRPWKNEQNNQTILKLSSNQSNNQSNNQSGEQQPGHKS